MSFNWEFWGVVLAVNSCIVIILIMISILLLISNHPETKRLLYLNLLISAFLSYHMVSNTIPLLMDYVIQLRHQGVNGILFNHYLTARNNNGK